MSSTNVPDCEGSDVKPHTCSSHPADDSHLTSDEHAQSLERKADMLRAAWDVSRSASDLKEAIGLYEQILQLRPLGHALRAKSITDLGDALFWSCLDREVVEDQGDRCLRLFREALELRLPGHDLRGQSLLNLARALFYIGFDQRGELETLTECVHVARQILHLRPAVSQLERVSSLNVLAGALMSLYEQHGGPEVLSEAAMVLRECLDLCPPEDPKRSRILTNNGLVMTATFELHGDMAALADAVSMHRKAVHVCPPGDAFRDYCLNNLAEVLKISFDSQGGLESLAETIAVHREVLQLRPLGHPLRHYSLTNLAGALSADASYRGHSDSSSEIVSLYREALSLLPVTHAERTRPMDGVAEYLLDAFRERGSQDALDEAIGLLREVLSLKPPGHLSRCASSITLARALRARFNARFDAHALSEAVALLREALLLHPRGHPQRLLAMEELADILHCTADYQSWNECLALYRQALEECPSGYPARTRLLCGMSRCFLDPKSPYFDLVTGVSHLSAGYADNSSHVSQRLRHAVSDLCRVETAFQMARKGFPTEYLSHYNGHVLDLYAQVIGLLPRAANFGINHKTRLQAVTGTDQISRNAAAHSLQIGRLPQAVEMLEEGRGVFWSQTLYLRATEFDRLPDHDRQELTHLLRNLESSANRVESSDQTAAQRERDLENHRRQNDEAEALIRKIRGYPGLDRFLLPPAFKSLFDALPDGFVAILNMSTLGHHALLLHRARGLAASLELEPPPAGFDSERMRAQIPRDIRAEAISEEAPMRAMRLDSGRYGSFQGVLADLWTSIGWPVVSKLGLQKAAGRARPRLWWCVTGPLGFLPVHAAGQYENTSPTCNADYIVSSYIPTLSSLTKARSGWEPLLRTRTAGLLICEDSSGHDSTMHLPEAAKEICLVRKCFESARAGVLNTTSTHTTVSELRALLEGTPAHILHLACHGVQEGDPLKSALVLQDGKLAVEDIMQLNLPHAILAYLSACQTAKGDKNAPDQAVHLAASMLFCGFRSVIGTMWLMHDEDGPKMARRFYEALFRQELLDLDDIAYALDEAIQELRSQGVPASRWALFMHMGG